MDMFFLRSFFGIFYLTFLPGFVLLRILKYKSTILRELLISFGLSLLINYIFTYLLGLLRLLSPLPYFIFSFLCMFFLIVLLIKEKERLNKNLLIISSSLFMLIFLWFLNQFVAKSGSIPWGGDDILGWNSWAMNWYLNKPVFSQPGFYPQMLPITWATSYFFSGSEKIFFFSRSIMPYFFFGIILFGWDSWWQKKNSFSFFGALSLFWLFIVWREFPRMTQGLADIPTAFFAFSSFIVLLETLDKKSKDKTLSFGLAILLATASALTKQYGALYYAGFFAIMLLFIIKNFNRDKELPNFKKLSIFLLLSFILLLTWYLYGFLVYKYFSNPQNIFSGGPFVDYKYNILKENSFEIFKNFRHSLYMLAGYFKSNFIFILLMFFLIISIFVWPFSWVLLFITIPAFLFWTMLIAYDIRNFSIGLLFFIYQTGIGISFIWDRFSSRLKFSQIEKTIEKLDILLNKLTTNKSFVYTLTILPLCIILIFSFIFTQDRLTKKQTKRMKLYLGNHRDVNKMLYQYLSENPSAIVYTDYPFIRHMPELTYIENSLTNIKDLEKVITTNKQGIFLIITGFPPTHISKECEIFIKTNKILKEVGRCENGYLIEWKK